MNKIRKAFQMGLKGALQLGVIALLLPPALTSAQQTAQQVDEEAQQDEVPAQQRLEEIVVTGTQTGTGIRGVAPVGSQTFVIPRAELLESPVRDAAEIIANLPQGSQIDSGVADSDGGNDAGGSGLNLRGLGNNASLQLLNGHRMASQGISSIGPDPSAIPFAAIQTVEVVLDGASSVYGSDAVAGVVNFIMRDDFEGLDVQLSGRSGVYDSSKIELVGGKTWGNINVMAGFSYEDQDAMPTNERAYLMEDLRRYGGNDNRNNTPTAGNSPVISVGSQDYFVPPNFVGQTITDPNNASRTFFIPLVSDLIPIDPANAGDYLADSGDYTTYNATLERTGLFLRANWEPTDFLQFSYTGMYSKREAVSTSWNRIRVRAEDESPYWIPGLTTRSNYTVVVSMAENDYPYVGKPETSTWNHYLDLRSDFGEWQMNGSIFVGRTWGADIDRPEANNAALTNDPSGTPDGYLNYAWYDNDPEWFNPYLTDVDQPGIDNLMGYTWRYADQFLRGMNVRFEGPIVELPGGAMRLNIGAEYTESDHWLGLPQTVRYYNKDLFWLRDTDIERDVKSVFAELYAPLVTDKPGIQRLALSVSARQDEYKAFGKQTTPRLGITWDVNDSVSFRASAGEAFRAPTLTQMNPGVNSGLTRSNNITVAPGLPVAQTNPTTGTSNIFTRWGRTPYLGPETADMWSVGFDLTPVAVEGLRIQFTYYDIEYSNRIETVPNWQQALSSAENYAIYEPYIYPITQPSTCVDGDVRTYHPLFASWLDNPDFEDIRFAGESGDCEIVAIIDRGEQNVGSLFQTGIDYQITYDWDTSIGTWRASVNVAQILNLDRSLINKGDTFDILDRIGWQ
ncbi:MAG: TonB-dependent receptor, partial [Gammaproteobacteria bacterium]|nr:TonB-dependent receptor [Gammaproteobacteria bacterium]